MYPTYLQTNRPTNDPSIAAESPLSYLACSGVGTGATPTASSGLVCGSPTATTMAIPAWSGQRTDKVSVHCSRLVEVLTWNVSRTLCVVCDARTTLLSVRARDW